MEDLVKSDLSTPSTFLNLEYTKFGYNPFLGVHALMTIIWSAVIFFAFRIDVVLLSSFYREYPELSMSLPFIMVTILFILLLRKSYWYAIAIIVYPILLLFWFIPKTLTAGGEVLLVGYYLDRVTSMVKQYRLIIGFAICLLVSWVLMRHVGSEIGHVSFALVLTIIYSLLSSNIIKGAFAPFSLFGLDLSRTVRKYVDMSEHETRALTEKWIEPAASSNSNVEDEKKESIDNLIMYTGILRILRNSLRYSNPKRTIISINFVVVILFMIASVFYLSYVTYVSWIIYPSGYAEFDLSYFDFIYSTFKKFAFEDFYRVNPVKTWSRIVDMIVTSTLGLFVMVFVITFYTSKSTGDIKESVDGALRIIDRSSSQLHLIAEEVYGQNLNDLTKEFGRFGSSLSEILRLFKEIGMKSSKKKSNSTGIVKNE